MVDWLSRLSLGGRISCKLHFGRNLWAGIAGLIRQGCPPVCSVCIVGFNINVNCLWDLDLMIKYKRDQVAGVSRQAACDLQKKFSFS